MNYNYTKMMVRNFAFNVLGERKQIVTSLKNIVSELNLNFKNQKIFGFLGNIEELRSELGNYTENLAFLKPDNYETLIKDIDFVLCAVTEVLEDLFEAEMFLVNENLIEIKYAVQGFRC